MAAIGDANNSKHVMVITNDSTVFLTEKWVSAFEMFGGRMTEVKNLVTELGKVCNVSMGIISGKFGFIPANYVVMKYDDVPDCKEDYEKLQKEKDYVTAIAEASKLFDKVIICVPKDMFSLLIPKLPDNKIIAVTNPIFEDECKKRGWTFYERKGARVGKENAAAIIEDVKNIIV